MASDLRYDAFFGHYNWILGVDFLILNDFDVGMA
jgi:hypothetical protein